MNKSWLISAFSALLFIGMSNATLAATVSDEEMQTIKQYCEEMNDFGAFASEEDRMQAVNSCISEEVKRTSEYGDKGYDKDTSLPD